MNRYFGEFGGQFVPETLMSALIELENAYLDIAHTEEFREEFARLLKHYSGRPTPLYFASNITEHWGGAKIYLKREDLNHTGAHKINNTIGQVLLAKKMGKKRIIAETGAGQHGVATATAAALLSMECEVYMGAVDAKRQELNLFRMNLLGAKVNIVESGTKTLKDATNEALRDWAYTVKETHYCIGSVVGPHPFPTIVRNFQSVIGTETHSQILNAENKLPSAIVACVGGGSNAMGIFYRFIEDTSVDLIGVEAAGKGLFTEEQAATLERGSIGVFHGAKSYLIQDNDGQIKPVHSISAGLDYPGVGPEHSYLKDIERAKYVSITDEEAVQAFLELTRIEGIMPALESSHAIGYAKKIAKAYKKDEIIIINVSGRGDKDVEIIKDYISANKTIPTI